MATPNDEATNYPSLPAKQWWALRDRFKRSLPGAVTASYLETTLNIDANTARQLVTQLRYLGLIDAENRPTEVAEDWRHDETYGAACEAIRKRVYPEELLHAVPDATAGRSAAERWFARKKRVGANAALKMAITYQLVSEADLAKAPDAAKGTAKKASERPRAKAQKTNGSTVQRTKTAPQAADETATPPAPPPITPPSAPQSTSPTLHIDVQIHIAADASAAQIDQIFASMAKHLYQGGKSAND